MIFGLLLAALALAAFEAMYRYQVVDTYLPELSSYNEPDDLAVPAGKDTLLVMGDSFSAGTYGYPSIIRRALKGYRVINSSVPGTGVVEAGILAPGRFSQFEPSVFLYQVFVGNDLLDISNPVNWEKLSLARNAYWSVSQRLRSLRYLNYRLGQLFNAARFPENRPMPRDEPFSAERYNPREKLLLDADPRHLESQILVGPDRRGDYRRFLSKLGELLSYCRPPRCRAYLLVVPHPCQVSSRYLERAELLGARFGEPAKVLSDEYPFLAGIGRFLKENGMGGVRLLNPIGALRAKESRGVRVYYQNNSHLNSAGQSLIAELLLQELRPPAGD